MAEIKRWRFFLPPQTHIRTTDSERWLFAEGVSEKYLAEFGMKKYLQRVAKKSKNPGTPNNYLNRKKTIQRYWDYKRRLKELADEQGFVMPTTGCWLRFFISMPKSWSKKKKLEKLFTPHTSHPDIDNCVKAAMDSLMKEDKAISDYRASKLWYDGVGFIEITWGELPHANGYGKVIREDKIK